MTTAHGQHEAEIRQTRDCWDRKPLLRKAYRTFHTEIRRHLAEGSGLTVELGSGIGVIKETIPECVTTDVFANPWVDRKEDAYCLSFQDASVRNLILFDVWHHLQFPGSAMEEFHRVLVPEGRVLLFEPAALSLLGRFVFGLFHHEPVHDRSEPRWFIPQSIDRAQMPYYAAQGNAWKSFRSGCLPPRLSRNWVLLCVRFYPAFEWLAAGGFRQRQVVPASFAPFLSFCSRIAGFFPSIFSTRMLVVFNPKKGTPA